MSSLLRLQLPLKPYHFYICGPTPMMESLVPALEDWGVPDARIHFEAFGPASIKRRHRALRRRTLPADWQRSDIVVTFAKSGKQLAWQPAPAACSNSPRPMALRSIPAAAPAAAALARRRSKSGEVAYRQPPDFDPEPGSCLLCVCAPKTSVTLEA